MCRLLFLGAFIVLFYSCGTNNISDLGEKIDLPLKLDTTSFVMNLDYDKIKYPEINDEMRVHFNIEYINEIHGDKYLFLFFSVGKIQIFDSLTGLITYAARNNKIALDTYYEKYNLSIFNSSWELIDSLELAKYRADFGQTTIKTAEINEKYEIFIDIFKETNLFEESTTNEKEKYKLNPFGRIEKLNL